MSGKGGVRPPSPSRGGATLACGVLARTGKGAKFSLPPVLELEKAGGAVSSSKKQNFGTAFGRGEHLRGGTAVGRGEHLRGGTAFGRGEHLRGGLLLGTAKGCGVLESWVSALILRAHAV